MNIASESALVQRRGVNTRSRAWTATLWSREDVSRLETYPGIVVLVVGEEKCPTTGRQHFHAFFKFAHARSFSSFKVHFPKVHFEVPNFPDDQCVSYCTKDGNVIVRRGLDAEVTKRRHKSGEVEAEVHRRLAEGETIRSVWSDHPIYCARNMRMLRNIVRVYESWGHRSDGLSVDNLSGLEL